MSSRPTQAWNFAMYDAVFKKLIVKHDADISPTLVAGSLLSGGVAGLTAMAITFGTITRADLIHYRNLDFISRMKLRYNGFGISIPGVMIYRSIYFGGYDIVKRVVVKDSTVAPFWQNLIIANVTTAAAGIASHPFDVVRKRMLIDPKRQQYTSYRDCCIKVIKNEGASALFKGSSWTYSRWLSGALCMALYEEIQKLL